MVPEDEDFPVEDFALVFNDVDVDVDDDTTELAILILSLLSEPSLPLLEFALLTFLFLDDFDLEVRPPPDFAEFSL